MFICIVNLAPPVLPPEAGHVRHLSHRHHPRPDASDGRRVARRRAAVGGRRPETGRAGRGGPRVGPGRPGRVAGGGPGRPPAGHSGGVRRGRSHLPPADAVEGRQGRARGRGVVLPFPDDAPPPPGQARRRREDGRAAAPGPAVLLRRVRRVELGGVRRGGREATARVHRPEGRGPGPPGNRGRRRRRREPGPAAGRPGRPGGRRGGEPGKHLPLFPRSAWGRLFGRSASLWVRTPRSGGGHVPRRSVGTRTRRGGSGGLTPAARPERRTDRGGTRSL